MNLIVSTGNKSDLGTNCRSRNVAWRKRKEPCSLDECKVLKRTWSKSGNNEQTSPSSPLPLRERWSLILSILAVREKLVESLMEREIFCSSSLSLSLPHTLSHVYAFCWLLSTGYHWRLYTFCHALFSLLFELSFRQQRVSLACV